MFSAIIDSLKPDRVSRYKLLREGAEVSYFEVLQLWETDTNFRNYFSRLLAESSFPAFRWETPAITSLTANQPFQFVLLNCPEFCARQTDRQAYREYFSVDDIDMGVVSFMNLGGDARLIVPSPRTEIDAYGHLAAFLRKAPASQLDAFWRVVSRSLQSSMGVEPRWLSTAGGGVAWLHVRIDTRPKYYGYAPYRSVSPTE